MSNEAWPDIRLMAVNTDPDSDNKIHSDETAAKYGFRGGLVTGVSMYAYTTQMLAAHFGVDFLGCSRVNTKLTQPVYDGEEVIVRGHPMDAGARVELLNSDGEVCAITEYERLTESIESSPAPESTPLPEAADRQSPDIEVLRTHEDLGSWCFEFSRDTHDAFCLAMLDSHEIYKGADPVWHPAWCVANANWMLMANVKLGPWIHTSSMIEYWSAPKLGATISLRGGIENAYERRENDMVDLFLFMIDGEGKQLGHIKHSAIIRLAQDKE